MTASWQYVDPPAPPVEADRYSRDEVLRADRWAWAGEAQGRRAGFFYDGFEFWRQLRGGERQAVSRLDAPVDGWWHKPACNCPLCRASARDGVRELAGTERRGR